MIKLFFLFTLLVSNLFSIEWKTYNEAILSKENKPIFYVLSATYCNFCKNDLSNIEQDSDYINSNFIPVKQEMDIEEIPNYLSRPMTPTYFVLNKRGEIINEVKGSQTRPLLLQFLNISSYKFKGAK